MACCCFLNKKQIDKSIDIDISILETDPIFQMFVNNLDEKNKILYYESIDRKVSRVVKNS